MIHLITPEWAAGLSFLLSCLVFTVKNAALRQIGSRSR